MNPQKSEVYRPSAKLFVVHSREQHEKNRKRELAGGITRCLNADKAIPTEWLEEYNELANKHKELSSK